MKFDELLETVGGLPLFRGSLLLAGDRDAADVRRQLSRWTSAGKILQLRRNLYALAKPWRRVEPHPFLIANELHAPSYVSLQSGLAYAGLIPEAVPQTTSVTTGRPIRFDTPFGRFVYRRIHPRAFFGFQRLAVTRDQDALIGGPEKALLDLAYLAPNGETVEHLESLRLDGLESLSESVFRDHARRWQKKKVDRAVDNVLTMSDLAEASS